MTSARAKNLDACSRFGRPGRAIPAHGRRERPQEPVFRRNQAPSAACPKARSDDNQRHGARACLIHTFVARGDECPKRAMEACEQHRIKRTFSKNCRRAKQPGCQPVGMVKWSAAKNGAASMGRVRCPRECVMQGVGPNPHPRQDPQNPPTRQLSASGNGRTIRSVCRSGRGRRSAAGQSPPPPGAGQGAASTRGSRAGPTRYRDSAGSACLRRRGQGPCGRSSRLRSSCPSSSRRAPRAWRGGCIHGQGSL